MKTLIRSLIICLTIVSMGNFAKGQTTYKEARKQLKDKAIKDARKDCLLYTSPSPRD